MLSADVSCCDGISRKQKNKVAGAIGAVKGIYQKHDSRDQEVSRGHKTSPTRYTNSSFLKTS